MSDTALETGSEVVPDASMVIERILVPFDFSGASERALELARKLAPRFGASIEALYVVPYMPRDAVPIPRLGAASMGQAATKLLADGESRLHSVLAPNDPRYRDVRRTVEIGDPHAQILARAAAENVDLIVMGTHGRTGVTRFVLGSVAERVVREATCPVLTVH